MTGGGRAERGDRGSGAGGASSGRWPEGCPLCVLLNPAAGREPPSSSLRRALKGLSGAEVRVPADAAGTARLARAAESAGCRRLVVAGGDGTVHRVVTALRDPAEGPALGLVPTGTGNDFARALGVPPDPEAAVRVAARGPVRSVDGIAFRVGDRRGRAVNFVLGGVGGDIAGRVTAERKRRWRRLVYLRAAADELGALESRDLLVEADGDPVSSGPHLAVLVANGPTLGSGIPAAPGAEVDDGRLELVAVRGDSAAHLVGTLARVVVGRHLASRRVSWRSARRVSVRGAPRMPFNADGEDLGVGTADVRVLPGALSVAAPPGAGQRSPRTRASKG